MNVFRGFLLAAVVMIHHEVQAQILTSRCDNSMVQVKFTNGYTFEKTVGLIRTLLLTLLEPVVVAGWKTEIKLNVGTRANVDNMTIGVGNDGCVQLVIDMP